MSTLDGADASEAVGTGTAGSGTADAGSGRAGTATAADPDSTGTAPRSLFRNRDYLGWWIGETVSTFGSSLSQVAYPLLMLVATGSAAQAGIVGAAAALGRIGTLLIGGALADRSSRRAILTVGPLLQAVLVGSIVVAVAAGHVNV